MGIPDLPGHPLPVLNHPFREEIPSDVQLEPPLKSVCFQCILLRTVAYKGNKKSEGLSLELI